MAKGETGAAKASDPKFSSEDIACMIAFIRLAGGQFGKKEFDIMSKVDGTRTSSSYDHSTRTLRTMATEIVKKVQKGEFDGLALPASHPKRGKSIAPKATATPGGKRAGAGTKRAKETKESEEVDSDGDEDAKKVKLEHVEEAEPEVGGEFENAFYHYEKTFV